MSWDSLNLAALEGLQDGDMEPVIKLLKEPERGIHPEVRLLLAELLEPNDEDLDAHPRQSTWRLIAQRRRNWRPETDSFSMAMLGHEIAARVDAGDKKKLVAIPEVCAKYQVGRDIAERAYKLWRKIERREAEDDAGTDK
jgi:hypothetical protein